jgi:hypothetical protein
MNVSTRCVLMVFLMILGMFMVESFGNFVIGVWGKFLVEVDIFIVDNCLVGFVGSIYGEVDVLICDGIFECDESI